MSKLHLLDLFCGAGGASFGYADAGFSVVGVDIVNQPNYPFEFVQADAMDVLDFLLDDWVEFVSQFDVIHASPPCQTYSAYRRRGSGVGTGYAELINDTRTLLGCTDKPWIIENIPDAPLVDPVQLCGSSFGLDIRRHRLFESNVTLAAPPCNHTWQTPRFPPATNRMNRRSTVEVGSYRCARLAPAAMGIDWMANDEISEAVPPAYTNFLGRQLHAYVRARHEVGALT